MFFCVFLGNVLEHVLGYFSETFVGTRLMCFIVCDRDIFTRLLFKHGYSDHKET